MLVFKAFIDHRPEGYELSQHSAYSHTEGQLVAKNPVRCSSCRTGLMSKIEVQG